MEKSDFTYKADRGGYMIYYKNRPIGGAMTLSRGSNLRNGIAIRNQIREYGKDAERTINSILNGFINPSWQNTIDEIDKLNT